MNKLPPVYRSILERTLYMVSDLDMAENLPSVYLRAFLVLMVYSESAYVQAIISWATGIHFITHRIALAYNLLCTVYPKKYAPGFCFAVLCCGYTLTDFPISTRLTSLALWQSNDCPSASKSTLMNMDKYVMWIHYERLHNHNKAKHDKTVCIFLGIYCMQNATSTYTIISISAKRI